jgi:hypothetical protein
MVAVVEHLPTRLVIHKEQAELAVAVMVAALLVHLELSILAVVLVEVAVLAELLYLVALVLLSFVIQTLTQLRLELG